MKLPLLSLCLVSMVGCVSSLPPPPAPEAIVAPLPQKEPLATQKDCDQVYGSILGIKLAEETREQGHLSDEQILVGIAMLDAQYRSKGVTQSFYANCVDRMPMKQVECMTKCTTLEQMSSLCTR